MQLIHESINKTHTTRIYKTGLNTYVFQLTDYTGALLYERTYSTEQRARQGQLDYCIHGPNVGTTPNKGTGAAINTDHVSAGNNEKLDTAQ